MAQDRLIAFTAGGLVLIGGASAELLAARSALTGILDWAIGAAWTVAALRAFRPSARDGALGLLTAIAWFLATVLAPAGSGPALAIGYRGPLLHWVTSRSMSARTSVPTRLLIVAGYLVALFSTTGAAIGTGAISLALGALLLHSSRRRTPADLRRVDAGAGALLALLGLLWSTVAIGLIPGILVQAVSEIALLASAWYLSRPAAELTTVIGNLVLDLGPSSTQASPVSASLATALADPGLQIRAYRPDLGWRDELGRPTPDPAPETPLARVTAVDTPGGGRVVLLHGPDGVPDTELARAAATAAALVLERVSVEAQVRQEADEVRQSTARLVTVNDTEREALALQLAAGPLERLDRVRRSLRIRDLESTEPVLDELGQVIEDLHRLAAGLNPMRIAQGRLEEALNELTASAAIDVRLTLSGSLAALSEERSALIYFASAELLTNATRHSGSPDAELDVTVDDTLLLVEIRDHGKGGASTDAGHGLQGLSDRMALAGGSLEIDSPLGGPTIIRASASTGLSPG